jgi:hypothetical protein
VQKLAAVRPRQQPVVERIQQQRIALDQEGLCQRANEKSSERQISKGAGVAQRAMAQRNMSKRWAVAKGTWPASPPMSARSSHHRHGSERVAIR